MNATTTATTSFTIKAPLFDDLLSGALIAAGKDSSLPVLTCLQLESRDGKLIAAATDRYRLFIGRLAFDTLELKPENDLKILILRDDVAKIRSLIKPLTGKRVLNPYVQLTIDGERITGSC